MSPGQLGLVLKKVNLRGAAEKEDEDYPLGPWMEVRRLCRYGIRR